MDIQSCNNVEVSLTQHRLLNCTVKTKIKSSPDIGGSIVISLMVGTPEKPKMLKKGDTFDINVEILISGKVKDTDEDAFNVSCEMEGTYELINCGDNGIPTVNNAIFWTIPTKQLFPLNAQFANDLLVKMGFRNINIPLSFPNMLPLQKKVAKVKSKK